MATFFYYIDESNINGNGTWSWAEIHPWCTGNGSKGNPYVIQNITINKSGGVAIKIENSNKYFKIKNCTIKNADKGINLLETNNGIIYNNTLINNSEGIKLEIDCDYNVLKQNKIIENNYGIYISGGAVPSQYSNHNIINDNSFFKNNNCIYFNRQADFNNIINNSIINNGFNDPNHYGIYIRWSSNNSIFNNTISYHRGSPIYILANYGWGNNSLINNRIMHNLFNGIYLAGGGSSDPSLNTVMGNSIINHTTNGIYLKTTSNDNIYNNTIKDSDEFGIHVDGDTSYDCTYINIYNNSFFNSGIRHAQDDGSFIYWNNSQIGNYWDDYQNLDLNDDGIGDDPYYIAQRFGNQYDFLPIWRDGPSIKIIEPYKNEIFTEDLNPPNFNISINDPELDKLWYTLESINKSFIIFNNGTLNSTLWENITDRNITLTFFGNDSEGNINANMTFIIKDTSAPRIIIHEPIEKQNVIRIVPTCNISIIDPTLNYTWYSLDLGITNHTIMNKYNITINQSVWEKKWDILSHGDNISIIFYANDSLGRLNSSRITVKKYNPPNLGPDIPEIIYPSNGSINIPTMVNLTVNISDPDNDTLIVYFLNAIDDTLIASVDNVNGSGTIVQVYWNLSGDRLYKWYVKVFDGINYTLSPVWTFTTTLTTTSNPIPSYDLISIAFIIIIYMIIIIMKRNLRINDNKKNLHKSLL